jgi:hypothetical protein
MFSAAEAVVQSISTVPDKHPTLLSRQKNWIFAKSRKRLDLANAALAEGPPRDTNNAGVR